MVKINAQQWLDQNYPSQGTCVRKDDFNQTKKHQDFGRTRAEIEELDISNKELEGDLDLVLSNFTSIRKFNCSVNELTGNVIFPDASNLEELDYSYNKMEGEHEYILDGIKKFNCSHNNIRKITAYNPFSLTHFDVSNNQLTDLDLRNSSANLQELNCSGNPLVNFYLSPSSSLSSLINCPTPKSITQPDLGTSDKIALGIGVPGLILTVVGVWIGWKQYKKRF